MIEPSQHKLPLKQATIRIAGEIENLHERLERLEFGLEAVFAHSCAGLDGQTIGMIQELDMLRQSLGALANFMQDVSGSTDEQGISDQAAALAKVPLRDMAVRLAGARDSQNRSGQTELF